MIENQQTLNVALNESVSLNNFVVGDNSQLVASLSEVALLADSKIIYLWGEAGVGKTHLLQGVCHLASGAGNATAYIPMTLADITVEYLHSLEQLSLLCVDDIHLIAGKPDWEQAYFHLYNLIRDSGHRLIVSANAPIRALPIQLEDLRSRLSWGLVYQVQRLSDEGKMEALIQKAKSRGFELPDNVAQFILRRCPRDSHSLFEIIEKLDQASLTAQRKITIPFVREIL